jgi:hypothetical protein
MAGRSRSHWSLADPQHCFQALWQYRGMGSLATALRIKLKEVLYVPWAWHLFSLLRSQADISRSAHLGYPEGTFLAGGKFVHALSVKHPPEDQIIHLELPALNKPLVVAPKRLPVACIFNSNIEEDALHAEVLCRPKCDREGDATAWRNRHWAHS